MMNLMPVILAKTDSEVGEASWMWESEQIRCWPRSYSESHVSETDRI